MAPWINGILARQNQQRRQPSLSEGGIAEFSAAALQGVRQAVQSLEGKEVQDSKGKGKGKQVLRDEQDNPSFGKTVWLHCSVGEPGSLQLEEEEAANNVTTAPPVPAGETAEPNSVSPSSEQNKRETECDQQQESAQNTIPLSGFDRLREAGFSEDEITNIRAQFHNDTLGSPTTEAAGILEREEQEAQARQLEEQWMEGLGAGGVDPSSRKLGVLVNNALPLTSHSLATAGMYTTLFKGVVAGFFFPFLPLFFFTARGGAGAAAGLVGEGNLFSKRMQMAIVAGLSINVLYGALRAFA